MYSVKKNGALWQVVCNSSGLVQFKSLRRVNCSDWIKDNDKPKEENSANKTPN